MWVICQVEKENLTSGTLSTNFFKKDYKIGLEGQFGSKNKSKVEEEATHNERLI